MRLKALLQRVSSQVWECHYVANSWQPVDGNSGVSAAVNGCGCFAGYAAFQLAACRALSGLQRPTQDALGFLRWVAATERVVTPAVTRMWAEVCPGI